MENDGQLYRYVPVFAITVGCQLAAFFWIFFVVHEKRQVPLVPVVASFDDPSISEQVAELETSSVASISTLSEFGKGVLEHIRFVYEKEP